MTAVVEYYQTQNTQCICSYTAIIYGVKTNTYSFYIDITRKLNNIHETCLVMARYINSNMYMI